ncbi:MULTISPECIES: hypothetical protein [Lactococcus]|uniref:hypothetical protein n=1 Tax=Lactococcus TaxID=1357 RepID=UPI001F569FAF|nr:hypothetical protein [Lactococcus petauri]
MIKETLLVKNSGESSLGFDFENNVPYIQRYKAKKVVKSYSYSNTFFLSYLFLGLVGFMGIFLDYFFKFPVLISLIISILIGISLGKTVVYLTVIKLLGEKKYCKIDKKQIEKAIKNKSNLWGLRIVKWFIIVLFIIFSLMLFDKSIMAGGDFIAIILGVFGVTYIETAIHPSKGIKAIKILKKQLKEGKFDD